MEQTIPHKIDLIGAAYLAPDIDIAGIQLALHFTKGHVEVGIAGTNEDSDWFTNFYVRHYNGYHRGFYKMAEDVCKLIELAMPGGGYISLRGHSLGAAVALIAHDLIVIRNPPNGKLYYAEDVLAIGVPKFERQTIKRERCEIYTFKDDPIDLVPPRWMGWDMPDAKSIGKNRSGYRLKEHALEAYSDYFIKQEVAK